MRVRCEVTLFPEDASILLDELEELGVLGTRELRARAETSFEPGVASWVAFERRFSWGCVTIEQNSGFVAARFKRELEEFAVAGSRFAKRVLKLVDDCHEGDL